MATPQPPQGPGRQRINRNLAGSGGAAGAAPQFLLGRAAGMSTAGAAMSTMGGLVSNKVLGPAATLAAIMVGVLKTTVALVKQTEIYSRGIERAASVEKIESGFTAIYRSAQRAKQEVKALLNFANTTPFRFDSVLEAAKTLTLLTRGAYSGAAAMKRVGDASAATNTDIRETAFWIGRLYNFMQQGRSVQGLLFRMQDLGVVTGQLANELERLEASGGSFLQKWSAVEKELSKTEGAMAAESKSLDGLRTKLERTSELMAKGFGGSFLEQEKNATYATIKLYEQFSPVIQAIGRDVSDVTAIWRGFTAGMKGSWVETMRLGDAASVAWTGFKALAAGVAGIAIAGGASFLGKGLIAAGKGGTRMQALGRARDATKQAGVGSRLDADSRSQFGSAMANFAAFNLASGAGDLAGAGRKQAAAYMARRRDEANRMRTDLKARAAAEQGAKGIGAMARRIAPIVEVGANGALAWSIFRSAIGGVATALRTALSWVGRMVLGIGFINLAIAAIAAGGLHFYNLSRRMKEATAANEVLRTSIKDTSKALNEQITSVKTLADFHDVLAVATTNLANAQAALAAYRKEGMPAQDIERKRLLEQGVAEAEAGIQAAKGRGKRPFLLTPEQAQREAGNRNDRETGLFQNAVDASEGGKRSALFRERAAKLRRDALEGGLLIESEKADGTNARNADLNADRSRANDEIAQAQSLRERLKTNRKDVETEVRGDISTRPLSQDEQTDFEALSAKYNPADKPASFSQLTQEEGQRFRKLRERASGVGGSGGISSSFGDADVQKEIDNRLGGEGRGKARLKEIDEQQKQMERQSQDPIVRVNREAADLMERSEASKDDAEAGRLIRQAREKQVEVQQMQGRKDTAIPAMNEAERLDEQAAENDFRTANVMRELGVEKEILGVREEGLLLDAKSAKLRLDGLKEELEATRRKYNADGNSPDDPRIAAAEIAVARGEKDSSRADTALAVGRSQQEIEANIAKLKSEGLDYDIESNRLRIQGAQKQLAILEEARGAEDDDVIGAKSQIDELERQRRSLELQRKQTTADLNTQGAIANVHGQGSASDMQRAQVERRGLQEQDKILEDSGVSKDDDRRKAVANQMAQSDRSIEGIKRSQDEARMNITDSRAATDATLRGDKKGARAIEDNAAIRERAVGLSETFGMSAKDAEAQARSDYMREQAAAAMDEAPRITADSLQSIGGGGGAQGVDPLAAVMERNAKAAEMSYTTLLQIQAILGGNTKTPMEKAGYQ